MLPTSDATHGIGNIFKKLVSESFKTDNISRKVEMIKTNIYIRAYVKINTLHKISSREKASVCLGVAYPL